MRKSKWEDISKRLGEITEWAAIGLTEEQICKNLGIGATSLGRYKKAHKEVVDALKKGRSVVVSEIENALVKRALGIEYTETKTYIKQGEDGKTTKYTEKTSKYFPPDVGACALLLKNKDKEHWCDNPLLMEIKKQLLDLRKKEVESKLW